MGTKDFNYLDYLISKFRYRMVNPYILGRDIILDIGCGHQANFLILIKSKISKGIGIDYDTNSRRIGHNISIKRFKFKTYLPFPNDYFDKVCMLAVIEHIDLTKIPALMKEIRRVLKPKGRLILTTPTPKAKGVLDFLAGKLKIISKAEIADHKKYYDKKDMAILSQKYGFQVVAYRLFQFGLNSLCILQK